MQKSSFFNSIDGDRKYKAEEWAEYFASFIGNGVFPEPSTNLMVEANTDMTVTVKAGKAWINGYFYYNTADLTVQLDNADGVLKRIDRIVVRWSLTNRNIEIAVKKGTFASSPVAPVLQRDSDIFELSLADIAVNNGVIQITQVNITDQRQNSSYCGIVAGTVDQIDASGLFAQYEQAFNDWFATLEDVLDENTAANLLNLINGNTSKIENVVKFPKATGIGTAIVVSTGVFNLVDGQAFTFVSSSDNNGAATTINADGKGARPVYKPNTTNAPNIKAGKAITVWYDGSGDNFFLKASAEGNAIAANVLAGKTFSNDDDTGIEGTLLTNHSKGYQIYSTPGTYQFVVPSGVNRLLCQLYGGGGGGSASSGGSAGNGGGGGGFTYGYVSVEAGEVVDIIVGQGGLGGQTAGAAGANGTQSIVKGLSAPFGYGATFSSYGSGATKVTVTGDVIMSSGGGRGGTKVSTTYAGAGGGGGALTDGMDASSNSAGQGGKGNGLIPAGGQAPTGNTGAGYGTSPSSGGTGGGWSGSFTTGGTGGNGRIRIDW